MTHASHPYGFEALPSAAMIDRSAEFCAHLSTRRSCRHFDARALPMEAVRNAIRAAAQAPSGANKQPWTFVVVTDPETKREIRRAAEAEEAAFYGGRAPQSWLDDLAALGTNEHKPFLEEAPALIVVFAQSIDEDGGKNYYVRESVGIACGMLLAALHWAGIATLTHTPSPMQFLGDILGRPANERAYLLIPIGYPAADCQVPSIKRKAIEDVLVTVGD